MKKQGGFGKFAKKFRIMAAIEKEDILLLTRLMTILHHTPEMPVDKLGNNMFHMACYMGKIKMMKFAFENYHLDIEQYNADGLAPIHLAVKGVSIEAVKWLWEHGADCHIVTQVWEKSPIKLCQEMLKDPEHTKNYGKIRKILDYLRELYFIDKRGYERRKFIWAYQKFKDKNKWIGKFPLGMAREIAEFL
ncbi:unnamed protein product [Blepharisma stoltei]|uniref:Ankyrin repeat domain-containing protein n=1 Tax=Blepharisma stoltei TaxID=1481888 RepID=A0AAU9JBR3_9CILI|nr:unnamed protein product [Blepharisma stoltei]